MKAIELIFDPSQFPKRHEKELKQDLRERCFKAKWHYESYKQMAAWLRLHEFYSPARTSFQVQSIYKKAFQVLAKSSSTFRQVLSLGCGGAQKDLLCLRALKRNLLSYTALDVGSAMVLNALLKVQSQFPKLKSRGIVADLLNFKPPNEYKRTDNLVLAFGLIPNFLPIDFVKLLRKLGKGQTCLISANLKWDNEKEENTILSQYDNALTKQWLSLLPKDLGFDLTPGDIEIAWKTCPYLPELKRIEANYRLRKKTKIHFGGEDFYFQKGEILKLFYSYRYTPEQLIRWLNSEKIEVIDSYLALSEREGVFFLKRM